MKKNNFLVVVSIIEGCKFPARNSAQYMLTIQAKFDGQSMMTDPVAHVENPNFTQELAWPVDSKALHQHKLQRSAVKVIVSSSDANAGPAGREEMGYVVLNLRAAQHEKTYAWHPLLNCREKGCKLKLGIYIDDDNEVHEDTDTKPVDTAAGNTPMLDSTDSQSLKLMALIDNFGRYYQIGSTEPGCDMYTLSVTIDAASGLLQLIPTNVALSSMPYFFYYSLLGSDVTTSTFDDLLSPHFCPQQASVRLSCKPDVIRQFLGVQKPLQIHLFCGDQLLGSCDVPVDVLTRQFGDTNGRNTQPVSISDYYSLRPPKSSKVMLPAVAPNDSKPRVRVTVAMSCDTNVGRCVSPSGQAGRTSVKNRGSDVVSPRSRTPVQSPTAQEDSYAGTFDSDSRVGSADVNTEDNGDKPPAESNAPAAESKCSGSDVAKSGGDAANTSSGRSGKGSDRGTLTGTEPSSATDRHLLVPALPRHFNISIDLRRIANLNVSHPVLIFVRYTYVFFGSTEPVVSRPAVEVCRGTEVAIPQSCCTFPFATTSQHLQETFLNIPLVVEVWQRDRQRSENRCLGIVNVPLSAVLRSPRMKFVHTKSESTGTRQMWSDWLRIIPSSGSERRLGDLEVALTLEDLGPIVQPTVQLDAGQKSVAPVSAGNQQAVDVRETLEYKKAMELQLWLEEQQALYKAQEQQRLKALDEEFHRKLAVEMKKGAEYDRLAAELRTALTSLEKREKVLKASEEKVEKHREDLLHKHAREMERLRDASVRLKEEYEHKMELERSHARDQDEIIAKLKRQLAEAEAKIHQQARDFEAYKNQLHTKPEVQLQAEINLLTLEKVELEKKLDSATKEKAQYRQHLEKALAKISATQKKEKSAAKAQLLREKRELEDMRLRCLAAEEKKVIATERTELDELKSELSRLKQKSSAGVDENAGEPAGGNSDTDELDSHILRLIEERDSLLRTGVYSRSDRIVADLDQQIRKAESQRRR